MLQTNGSGISIDPKEYWNFMVNSERILLPIDETARRDFLRKDYNKSCILTKIGNAFYAGELISVDTHGYSMIIKGEEKRFSFSETENIFRPPKIIRRYE